MPPKDRNNENLSDLRLRSRQQYLEKREAQQLALLRKQVEEEAEEERANPRLSQREKDEFARNRETLRLAEERLAINEHTAGGYILPDADYSDKAAVLNRKGHDREYVSEVQQWENEQTSKVKNQIQGRSKPIAADDYEFVFDESQAVQWIADASSRLDPEKQRLEKMLDDAEQKTKSIEETRRSLPIYQFRDQLLAAIAEHRIIIVVAETGSGKTTQIPQYLKEAGYCKNGLKVGCTQPRRVAAMSVAARVAEEVGCRLGQEVGYSIRFEDKTTPGKTVLKYMTDGMLLRELMAEPDMGGYSALVVDEAHERALNTDVIMGLVKDIARHRDDLRVIISSATLDAMKFSKYFDDAPIFNVPGRRFQVDIHYTPQPEANFLSAMVTTCFQLHIASGPGDILVFLTGQEEIELAQQNIESTMKLLAGRVRELIVCPLYANLPTDLQTKVFQPTPPGARKVILATNIAETSLTVDGVVYVIDAGYVKQNEYNAKSGMESLVVTPISRAAANQRAGRAGRTGPGKCFRLYTKYAFYNELPESTAPEMTRVNLISVVLMLKSLGIHDLINFDFMDAPSPDALIKSLEELYMLGALNDKGELTKTGRRMAELPMDPKLSRALLAAESYGCVEEVLSIISLLPETGALFLRPKDKRLHADAARNRFVSAEGGDMMTLLNIWNQWCDAEFDPRWSSENYLQQRSLTRARDVRDQLQKLCDRVEIPMSSVGITDHIAIRKAILAGFFANTARLERNGESYRILSSGISAYIHPSSSMMVDSRKKPLVAYHSLMLTSKEFMNNVMPIEASWLSEVSPHYWKKGDVDKLGLDKKMPKQRQA